MGLKSCSLLFFLVVTISALHCKAMIMKYKTPPRNLEKRSATEASKKHPCKTTCKVSLPRNLQKGFATNDPKKHLRKTACKTTCGLKHKTPPRNLEKRSKRFATKAPKKHPGCVIWWFLPGCFLGDRFGVDPFGIYPWKKFCRRYSDLQKHEKCKLFLKIERDLDSEIDDMIKKEISSDRITETSIATGEEHGNIKNTLSNHNDINSGELNEYIEIPKRLEKLDDYHKNDIISTINSIISDAERLELNVLSDRPKLKHINQT